LVEQMKTPTIAICVEGGVYRFPEYEHRVPRPILENINRQSSFNIGEWFSNQYCDSMLIFDATSNKIPDRNKISSLIISGSHHMVGDRYPWIQRLEGIILYCINRFIPILGVCFGHQLLCKLLGGKIVNIDKFMIGSNIIEVNNLAINDWLFRGLPHSFPVLYSRKQAVIDTPPDVTVFNTNSPFIDAIAFEKHVRGIQFHPELDREILLYATYVKEHLLNLDNVDIDGVRNSLIYFEPIYSKTILDNFFKTLKNLSHFKIHNIKGIVK
jgi:GMP synthase (glutamine-hydrolysing)